MKVRLPNGQTVTFPDGMPLAEVTAIIQKQFPPTGQIESRPQPDQPPRSDQGRGMVGAFLENAVPEAIRHPSMIAQAPGALLDVARQQVAGGDLSGLIAPGVAPTLRQMGSDIASGSKAAYQRQIDQGRSGLVALLAATPIIGPPAAQAGEELAQGNIQAGVGHALGLMAPLAAGPAVRGAELTGEVALGNWLRRSGEKQYSQALGATTKPLKQVSERVVPGLIERGVVGATRPSLLSKAEASVKVAGDVLDEALANVPKDRRVDVSIAYRRLNDLKKEHAVRNADGQLVPANAQAERTIATLDRMQQELLSKDTSFENIRKFRKILDDQVTAGEKLYGRTITEGSELELTREVANGVRGALAKADKDVATANREISFWLDTQKVLRETQLRTKSQTTPLGQTGAQAAGAVGGLLRGGVASAIGYATGFKLVKAAIESAGWRTVSAVTKDRLASAMSKGDWSEAATIAGRIVAASPKEQ